MQVYDVVLTISARQSSAVEVLEEDGIPLCYMKMPIEASLDLAKATLPAADIESLLTRLSGPLSAWFEDQRRHWPIPTTTGDK